MGESDMAESEERQNDSGQSDGAAGAEGQNDRATEDRAAELLEQNDRTMRRARAGVNRTREHGQDARATF